MSCALLTRPNAPDAGSPARRPLSQSSSRAWFSTRSLVSTRVVVEAWRDFERRLGRR